MGLRTKKGSKAWALSDRSGKKYRICDMKVEAGTGYFIGKDEDDGRYNAVDHPQANLHKYAKFDDPKPLDFVLPEVDTTVTQATLDAYPVYATDGTRIL